MWDYYEYGDDLLGRMSKADKLLLPEFWQMDHWETCYDSWRWAHTAVKIDDVDEFRRMHPELDAAFASG